MLNQILPKHVTPNHLLFDRQLLYSSNATSTVVRNVTVSSSTTDKINHSVPNYFWDRWRYEYVVNLRKTQRTSELNANSPKINANDIVLVSDEKVPIHFWRIAIVPGVLPNRDSERRGVVVRIAKTNTILKRPVNNLFTVENTCHDTNQTDKVREQKFRREAAVVVKQRRKYEF